MKRFLITGFLLLGMMPMASMAQSGTTYDDDIYYTGDQAKKEASQTRKKQDAAWREQGTTNSESYYSSTGNSTDANSGGDYRDYGNSNTNGDDINYEDDY